MATTIASDIREEIKDRHAIEGTAYDDTIDRKVILACEEICSVDFSFLYVPSSTIQVTQNTIVYSTDANFKKLDEDNIYIGSSKNKLIPGTMNHIYFNPPATTGMPRMFHVAGLDSTNIRTIYIGYPTADAGYIVYYGWWRKHGSFTTGQVPLIVTVHNSAPVVAYASFLLNKELGLRADAQDDLAEFLGLMREMEDAYGYSGRSYDEIMKLREQYRKHMAAATEG